MSRHMQIDIRVIPFYEKPFSRQFPNIANLLEDASYTEPLKKEVSLYLLVDYLASLSNDPQVPSITREKISPHVQRLLDLKETARSQLLSRNLNELDQSLYRMEDLFEDMEDSL